MWVDRHGGTGRLTQARRDYAYLRLSPDGKKLALTILANQEGQLWVYDFDREAFVRLTSGAGDVAPNWSPDGQRLSFRSGKDKFEIAWQAADGSGAVENLTSLEATSGLLHSWSPDGKMIAFAHAAGTNRDVWLLPLEGEREPRPFLQTAADERPGGFSPDARSVVYVSDVSGRPEVYVQPFPGPGPKWQISTEGGYQPVWARNGREIFYRNEGKMMAVEVETGPPLSLSKPKVLFADAYVGARSTLLGYAIYDVTADGQRFLMIQNEEESAPTRIHVVLNWAEELKAKVAAGQP